MAATRVSDDQGSRVGIDKIAPNVRTTVAFHHIGMGFHNCPLCLSAIGDKARSYYAEHALPRDDHVARLSNDHLLATVLEDICEQLSVPTLLEALQALGAPQSDVPRMTFEVRSG